MRMQKESSCSWACTFCRYNSVAVLTTQANQYTVMTASEHFLKGSEYDAGNLLDILNGTLDYVVQTAEDFRSRIQIPGRFEQLSARDCLAAYATKYVSTRGDVLLI